MKSCQQWTACSQQWNITPLSPRSPSRNAIPFGETKRKPEMRTLRKLDISFQRKTGRAIFEKEMARISQSGSRNKHRKEWTGIFGARYYLFYRLV
ncbi:hypothetical protein JTE90_024468 [Oedothorax gibbosus]|uniref:Uncharacterized protein n=1 Tax=Oedothorax gibbosus TaxID=931172 RepID=A0AAV6UIJ3_9ARAC|nr:hypothetical protein JTE90_024468 [Oedothorax gibbosus]